MWDGYCDKHRPRRSDTTRCNTHIHTCRSFTNWLVLFRSVMLYSECIRCCNKLCTLHLGNWRKFGVRTVQKFEPKMTRLLSWAPTGMGNGGTCPLGKVGIGKPMLIVPRFYHIHRRSGAIIVASSGGVQKSICTKALPRTPLGSFQRSPRPPSWWEGGSHPPPQESVTWSETVGLRTRLVWDQKIGIGLGLAGFMLCCETQFCHARRHNDLGGHRSFSSTIFSFSILCLEHHYCRDQQWCSLT